MTYKASARHYMDAYVFGERDCKKANTAFLQSDAMKALRKEKPETSGSQVAMKDRLQTWTLAVEDARILHVKQVAFPCHLLVI
jgi:hypothetical protein